MLSQFAPRLNTSKADIASLAATDLSRRTHRQACVTAVTRTTSRFSTSAKIFCSLRMLKKAMKSQQKSLLRKSRHSVSILKLCTSSGLRRWLVSGPKKSGLGLKLSWPRNSPQNGRRSAPKPNPLPSRSRQSKKHWIRRPQEWRVNKHLLRFRKRGSPLRRRSRESGLMLSSILRA